MQPQDIAEHRKRIGFEVKIKLDDYFLPNFSSHEWAAKIADWCDTLEDWPIDQIRWALTEYRNNEPNRRPNPGHILQLLKKRRGEEYAKRMSKKPADPQPVVTDEDRARAKEFMAEKFPHLVKPIPEVSE